MKFTLWSQLATVYVVFSQSTEAVKIWKVAEKAGRAQDTLALNPRDPHALKIDWSGLVSAVQNLDTSKASKDVRAMEMEIPGRGSVSCTLRASPVLPESIAKRHPSVVSLEGPCVEGGYLSVNMNKDSPSSLSSTFYANDQQHFYVDVARHTPYMGKEVDGSVMSNPDAFVIYNTAAARSQANPDEPSFDCATKSNYDNVPLFGGTPTVPVWGRRLRGERSIPAPQPSVRPRILQSSPEEDRTSKSTKLRIAVVATPKYTNFHGNTVASGLNAVVALLSRLNGLFLRELGVFFQMAENSDALICLNGTADTLCNNLPDSVSIIDNNASSTFIAAKGVAWEDYDIGHNLLFQKGGPTGLAQYPSLCSPKKAEGASGSNNPVNDPFVIDYVAHEIGHQLGAAHTYKDCIANGFMLEGSVEPGSGSTILGYASLCGIKNLQMFSDPVFSSKSLEQMRDLIKLMTTETNCGEVVSLNEEMPVVDTDEFCVVPLGNAFQLRGDLPALTQRRVLSTDQELPYNVSSEEELPEYLFSWERMDLGAEPFNDQNVARFRTWTPTKSRSRFFPNLWLQSTNYKASKSPIEFSSEESLPVDSASMTFRFTARKLYDRDGVAGAYDPSLVGNFVYNTTTINFQSVGGPLKLVGPRLSSSGAITPNQFVDFTWSPGGTGPLSQIVKIAIARSPFKELPSPFDPSVGLMDLEWYETPVANVGRASVWVPALDDKEVTEVLVMIRSFRDACYFFDLQVHRLEAGQLNVLPPKPEQDVKEEEPKESIDVVLAAVIGTGAFALFVLAFAVLYAPATRRMRNRRNRVDASSSFTSYTGGPPVGRVVTENKMYGKQDLSHIYN